LVPLNGSPRAAQPLEIGLNFDDLAFVSLP
jgi:hypothetical protein